MKFITIWLFAFSAALLIAMLQEKTINAAPGPLLRVTELYQQSDIVAVGQVQAVSDQGTTFFDWQGSSLSGRAIRAELLVDKLIKGDSQAGFLLFDFFQPNDSVGFRTVSKGQYGMFFLKRLSSNEVSVTSPHYPYIIALPDPIQTNEVGLSRVAQELALVFNSSKTTLAQKISSIRAIETVESPSVNILLKGAFQTTDERLKLNIASALLKRGDTSALEYAVNTLLTPPQLTDKSQLLQLALSIESGVHDPDSLPQLVRLLKTKEGEFRRAIAQAIRATKAQSAIDPLSDLLFDSYANVRYVAVIGLAEITRQYEWGPAQDVFQDNEQRYLDHWKEWSKSRRK